MAVTATVAIRRNTVAAVRVATVAMAVPRATRRRKRRSFVLISGIMHLTYLV